MAKTKKELIEAIDKYLDKAEEELVHLRAEVIDYAEHNEPLDIFNLDGGRLESRLDGLGWVNGWVIDRLNQIDVRSPRSKVRKIRKAQGYNA